MRFFLIIILIFNIQNIIAQKDSTAIVQGDSLPVTEIVHEWVAFLKNTSKKNQIFLTEKQGSSSDLLSQSGLGLHLRNYGAGSLTTFSLNGHAASQTDIKLDGFSIQSNMNGLYDLSLLPRYFVNYIAIDGSSDGGEIGGSLDMYTSRFAEKEWLVEGGFSYGSFDDKSTFFTFNNNKKKRNILLKSFYRHSNNDFKFTNLNSIDRPRVRMTNAAFQQFGILQKNHFELRDSSFMTTHFWYVNNHREIPPTLTETSSVNFQDDALIHAVLGWEKEWTSQWKTKSFLRYNDEYIYYDSPLIQTDSRSRRADFRQYIKNQINKENSLLIEYNYAHLRAKVEDYELDVVRRNQQSLSLDYVFRNDEFYSKIVIKEERIDDNWSPFLFSWLGKYTMNPKRWNIDIILHSSRNYRFPTFNDLYWANSAFSGGNPDLLPEKSWKQEIQLKAFSFTYPHWNIGTTFNHSIVDNWILWTPDDVGKWTPENVKKVQAYSFKFNFYKEFKILDILNISFDANYQYTRSVNKDVEDNAIQTLNKQLLYIPLHSGGGNLKLYQSKKWNIMYTHDIQGKRFTTTDNSQSIPLYHVANLSFSYIYNLNTKYELEGVFELRNIWNEDYQIVANRPMPPIHFQGTLFLKFKK